MSKRRWMTMNAGLALIVAGLMLPLAIERAFGQAPVFGAWTELGPQRFYGLKPNVSGTELMSGQPSSIAVDLVNDWTGNTVYVATAGGGVWKSTNGLSATPQFVPISDPSLPQASGAIALDSRMNPPTIYVGTGDPDNPSNVNSYAGNGILISRDGGQTWTDVTSADGGTHPFKGMGFSRIIVDPTDPNVVLAATGVGSDGNVAHSAYPQENPAFDHLGIYRSADGGHTWSLVKHTPISGNNVNGFFHIDLAYEPVGDRFLAAISNQGLFASADGITWQPSDQMGITTSGLGAPEDMHRVSLATRNGTLWALVIAIPYPARPDPCTPTNGCPVYEAHELYELAPAAASWRRIETPAELAHKGFLGYVAAPPGSSGLVVAAEHLFRTDDISPSSPDWHHIEFGATASLHGDQHAIAFVDADKWYVGDDGGMFATHVRGLDWRSLNATLRTTEFYSATSNSTDSGAYVGGQQDNGQAVSSDGASWQQFLGGDGMYTHADPYNANGFFVSAQFGDIKYLLNAFPRVVFPIIKLADAPGGGGAFLTPFEILANDPVLYQGASAPAGFDFSQARILLTANINPWLIGYVPGLPPVAKPLPSGLNVVNNLIQYIAVDPQDPTTAYLVAGPHDPKLYRLTNISFARNATVQPIAVPGGLFGDPQILGHAAVSPVCSQGLYLAKVGFLAGEKILKTTTGGNSWINISGNLPNVPIHWITPDPVNPDVIYVGTNVGAFVATDGGVEGEQWQPLGTGLPNVPVMQLKVSATRRLTAATFGRGVWRLDLPQLPPYAPKPPVITGVTVSQTVLSPPDHRMVDIVVDYTSTDDCGTPTCTLSVTSNEPSDGLGDGDTPVDFEVIDNRHVRLRAERSALGSGRTYAIAVSCTGIDGLSTSRTTSVFVPRDAR